MKLLTFQLARSDPSQPRIGALLQDCETVVDLQAASRLMDGHSVDYFADMLSFLEAGQAARDAAERLIEFAANQRPEAATYRLDEIVFQAPVPRPRSIRDCLSFQRHLIQATRAVVKWRFPLLARLDGWVDRVRGRGLLSVPQVWYERPIYYKGNPHSVVGHEADVHWPAFTEKLDYELEFGIFIGRRGCNIAESQSRQHIAGYTIFNDFSARDLQLREMQGRLGPAKSKDFDTGNVLGPYLVTPDEVPDPYQLTMQARINGQQWSCGTSADMHFTFEQMIAYISQDETLYPGDFIGSGTVPGGCGLELDRWLQPGDTVELEVERLGILRNRVQRWSGP
jgi:2-keto-4-pentenoate hydratase/2-oxohepta-3-ene-1,7-dioic acid hydratase in catechol pathway